MSQLTRRERAVTYERWDRLAKVLLGDLVRASLPDLFAPLEDVAKRIALRYRLSGIETSELADFLRDRLEQWNAPTRLGLSIGEGLFRWSFRVADNRAKSVVRSRVRKGKIELDAPCSLSEGTDVHDALVARVVDQNESTGKELALIQISRFVDWLRSVENRNEELALLAQRLGLEGEDRAPVECPKWDELKTKAVAKRLRSLWVAFDSGGPMPAARTRRAVRIPTKAKDMT
ncbi:hypothetical protein DSM104443_00933 [Usitatibacter rugosus]|uniref:Uncharacterized protein n=1 Tax=Usitatibacter rugosus TaxID=2732067 RepID=A0A6M4GU73_9PROT|nr:hypothetical protein [Usitatibacter rugosus]QJR09883.1 hypothetical protein DSM104443_00933 [Usitatibacter rugosus]